MRRLHRIAAALLDGLAIGPARSETGRPLRAEAFFALCDAPTVEAAGASGDALGWKRMTEAEQADWTRAIEADQGVRATSVGWRRGEAEGDDSLAFWTVVGGGQNYRACAFTARSAPGLSEAIRRRYGAPTAAYDAGVIRTASWTAERSEIIESRSGAVTSFEIVTDE